MLQARMHCPNIGEVCMFEDEDGFCMEPSVCLRSASVFANGLYICFPSAHTLCLSFFDQQHNQWPQNITDLHRYCIGIRS